jgi:hypothetical protein
MEVKKDVKKEYLKPTLQVVELRKSSSLLQSSGTLGGYQYQGNEGDEGWEE